MKPFDWKAALNKSAGTAGISVSLKQYLLENIDDRDLKSAGAQSLDEAIGLWKAHGEASAIGRLVGSYVRAFQHKQKTAVARLKDGKPMITASKKPADVRPTETMLRKQDDTKAPESVSEVQLDDYRTDNDKFTITLIEKNLDKSREEADPMLLEASLEKSKSKLHKHRNPEASKGDINKVEEQRLADKKRQETEKTELASETPKKHQFWNESAGEDKLLLAGGFPIRIVTAMGARCDLCERMFDSHDGGQICTKCDKTFCPRCEVEHFEEMQDICKSCNSGGGTWQIATQKKTAQLTDSETDLDLEEESPEAVGEKSLNEDLTRIKSLLQEEKIISGENPEDEDGGDDLKDLLEDEGLELKKKPLGVPANPEGPAVDRIFTDVSKGRDESTGTPVEQRALIFNLARFSWTDGDTDPIIDQALRFLKRKHPQANLDESSLILDTTDPEASTITYNLVG
jgi:hypothetical protein